AEAAADDYAHDLMREAEVDPGALGRIFARLLDEYGDAEGIMAHFASHPQMVDRIEAAQAAAEGGVYDRPVITDAEWQDLREICGPRAAQEDSDSPGAQDDTDGRLGGRN
ncbi:MAG: M48 family metalloprotease, partial [Maritimibacter harenae]